MTTNAVGPDTSELRSLTEKFCVELEQQVEKLAAERRDLDAISALFKVKNAALDEREQKVSRREREVMNIRQIASDRKVQLETAQQNADSSDVARRKAEVSQRMAEVEKSKLEETVAILIRDKKDLIRERDELVARVEGLRAESLAEASDVAKAIEVAAKM
jgi:uncharacterized protein (DUF3084 family)